MPDWARSVAALGTAIVVVVVATIWLSRVIAPGSPQVALGPNASVEPGTTPTPLPPLVGAVPGLGGSLTVTGDREGTFHLTNADEGEPYTLSGREGRILFGGRPVSVTQISYDGLDFFPEPEDCTISTGNLAGAIGIGFAALECRNLTDVRGTGTIALSGEVGMPLDRLAARSLPPSGGRLSVGDETWQVERATLSTWQMPIVGGVTKPNLALADPQLGAALNISYDIETHELSAVSVVRGADQSFVAEEACSFARTELGEDGPRTRVVELTITCEPIEVPGLGVVPVRGTLVVDELLWPV